MALSANIYSQVRPFCYHSVLLTSRGYFLQSVSILFTFDPIYYLIKLITFILIHLYYDLSTLNVIFYYVLILIKTPVGFSYN